MSLLIGLSWHQSGNALEIEKLFMPGELTGKHEELEAECTNCHVRLRDTTQKTLCLDCHELVDKDIKKKTGFHGINPQAASLDCKICHSEHKGRNANILWVDRDGFSHEHTDFPLRGGHKLAQCSDCHKTDEKFREAKSQCYDCHKSDDAHKGELGKECDACHVPSGWGKSEFDHDRTGFKLRFSHREVTCNACHLDNKFEDTPKQCVGCHALNDVHENRFGPQCNDCHTEKSWSKAKFDHNSDTKFALKGKHVNQDCNSCHKPGYQESRKSGKVRTCYSCHKGDDVHNGDNGKKCGNCHVERGWHLSSFDHDRRTKFPLKGGHEGLACGACHVPGEDKKIDTDCHSCHTQDDPHRGDLGNECDACHNDITWQHQVRFDHDLTSFPLIGQHSVLGCESCHSSSKFSDAGTNCVECHEDDDVHKQALGQDCAVCHNPNAWLIWKFDHDQTDFSLNGAHSELHCHSCHNRPLKKGGNSTDCVECHYRDDIHEGNFGSQCGKCHNDESFENPRIQSLRTYEWRTARLALQGPRP